jgi:hypothetical protein
LNKRLFGVPKSHDSGIVFKVDKQKRASLFMRKRLASSTRNKAAPITMIGPSPFPAKLHSHIGALLVLLDEAEGLLP